MVGAPLLAQPPQLLQPTQPLPPLLLPLLPRGQTLVVTFLYEATQTSKNPEQEVILENLGLPRGHWVALWSSG